MLELNELVAAESRGKCQGLLGQPLPESQLSDIRPHAMTTLDPSLLTLWVDSVSAGGHPPMSR